MYRKGKAVIETHLGTLGIKGDFVYVGGVLDKARISRNYAQRLQSIILRSEAKPDYATRQLISAAAQTGWLAQDKAVNLLLPKFHFQVWWDTLRLGLTTETKLVTLGEKTGVWEGQVIGFTKHTPHALYVANYLTDVEMAGKRTKLPKLPSFTVDEGDEAQLRLVVQNALGLHIGSAAD